MDPNGPPPILPPLDQDPSGPIVPPRPDEEPIQPELVQKNRKKEKRRIQDRLNFLRRKKEPSLVNSGVSEERLARDRTSETVVRAMAAIAVQLAIRTNHPERQRLGVKLAEQTYLSHLWNKYTKRALHLTSSR